VPRSVSTPALFELIERTNPIAKRITISCDNARYYRSNASAEYWEDSWINAPASTSVFAKSQHHRAFLEALKAQNTL
jgi:hypothetical protein